VGAAFAEEAELEQSAATVVVARTAELDQAAAGALIADSVTARNSAIGLLITRELHGDGDRVLLGLSAACAFGAGAGLVLWMLSRVRR